MLKSSYCSIQLHVWYRSGRHLPFCRSGQLFPVLHMRGCRGFTVPCDSTALNKRDILLFCCIRNYTMHFAVLSRKTFLLRFLFGVLFNQVHNHGDCIRLVCKLHGLYIVFVIFEYFVYCVKQSFVRNLLLGK